jgi:pSer/pThr/pTyr-binding forkhead associated (FHA) protein
MPEESAPEPQELPELTKLESIEDIRAAIEARRAAMAGVGSAPTLPPAVKESSVVGFRPRLRAAVPLLILFDDGRDEGEIVRLRGERCIIGRVEGDIVIPHDELISARHAELVRIPIAGGHRWYLGDLDSTNGTYVRVGQTLLKNGVEILVGHSHFRFETPADSGKVTPQGADPAAKPTMRWQGASLSEAMPALLELTPDGSGRRIPLMQQECCIGSDPACAVAVANDPCVNPRHVRLFRDAKGRWRAENLRSVNGLWLRIRRIPLDSSCQFQLGEQRFAFRLPG